MQGDDCAPPMFLGSHSEWYHGSPFRLETLRADSTVTPVIELAKAFAHKPTRVSIRISESDAGRGVTIEHDGQRDGYLYKALVNDPARDLQQHPESGLAPGEEMLSTRDLPLEFVEELPLETKEAE